MTAPCPSAAADRYFASLDPPETCVCGAPNSYLVGEDSEECLPTFPFCSEACKEKYLAEQRVADEAAYRFYEENKR